MEHIFRNRREGFFVELGAADGKHFSNTYALEHGMNWPLEMRGMFSCFVFVCLSVFPYLQVLRLNPLEVCFRSHVWRFVLNDPSETLRTIHLKREVK